jgi:hypothetical protein
MKFRKFLKMTLWKLFSQLRMQSTKIETSLKINYNKFEHRKVCLF